MTDLRRAQPRDLPGLDIIRRQAVEDGFTDVYERRDFADLVAQPDEQLEQWVENEGVMVLLRETQYSPVSYGVYDPESSRILGLYTAPGHQGRGHATSLLKRFEEEARNRDRARLSVLAPFNATKFFEKQGFRVKASRTDQGLPCRAMEKELQSCSG